MKPLSALIIAALVVTQSTNHGASKSPVYHTESSAYSLESKGTSTYVTENRSFRFVDVLSDKGDSYETTLLLEETYRNERTDGVEGARGNAEVKAWTLRAEAPRTFRWNFRETGNEGMPFDRLFRVTNWACCDAPVTYSYYSLLTGHKLYVSNSELREVLQDGGGPQAVRLIGFGYAGDAGLDQPPRLQYGTDKKIIQEFSVVSSRQYFDAPRVFVYSNGKLEQSLDLRGSTTIFTIVLRYEDGIEIRIPVEADTLRSEKAVVPQGYSLKPEK